MFRAPIYLDLERLVPLAQHYGMGVLEDVDLTERDNGERSFGAGIGASIPVPGGPSISLGGKKGSAYEVTQSRRVSEHQTAAFNRVRDHLEDDDELVTAIGAEGVRRNSLVDLEGEWDIPAAVEAGGVLGAMVAGILADPRANEPSDELIQELTTGDPKGRTALLAELGENPTVRVLVLLEPGCLVGGMTLDDLVATRSVFGSVDAFVPEGRKHDLEPFFMAGSGANRQLRRTFKAHEELPKLAQITGRDVTADDLKVAGPVAIIRPVAIY